MPNPGAAYEPERYWENQHRDGSLRAVGQSGLPVELNKWLYRIGRRNVLRFLSRNGITAPLREAAFDVGAGTGYWTKLWQEMGATKVDGCDLVPLAVRRLRERFLGEFIVGDIADANVIPAGQGYGFVAVMNVLLHVRDDGRFRQAAQNIAQAVRPGGHLLLAEAAFRHPPAAMAQSRDPSSWARSIGAYVAAFESGGLEFVSVGPSTVIGANPIDAPNRYVLAAWSVPWWIIRTLSSLGPRAADATGRWVSRLDRVLMLSGAAPSGKLILFRRPASIDS